ncbi:MAG: trehalase-like domain-containing protein, partial [Nocardioidaceae bacterium]
MTLRLEDYALLGDLRGAALVGVDGSVDWLCLPRFDAPSCLSALVGGPEAGRWTVAPEGTSRPGGRRYRPGSMVLETDLSSGDGTVRVTDVLADGGQLVRVVSALQGTCRVRSRLDLRFEYGTRAPLWRLDGRRAWGVAGP